MIGKLTHTSSNQDRLINKAEAYDPLTCSPETGSDIIDSLLEICEELDAKISEMESDKDEIIGNKGDEIADLYDQISNLNSDVINLESQLEE